MSEILSITGTVFALIAVGYAIVRAGVLDKADLAGISRFVVTLALPALIFRALTSRELTEIVDLGYLAAYLLGSLAMLGGGWLWSRRIVGHGAARATFDGMGMSCANSGFVGYPILAIAMPAVAGNALALNMVVETVVVIPLILAMAETATAGGSGPALARRIGLRVAMNPIVIAIAAGVAVSLLPVTLPALVVRSVGFVADSATALSLFVIGGSLVGLPLRAVDLGLLPVLAGKLVLHPLAVAAAFLLILAAGARTGPDLVRAGIVMAAMPPMGIYPLLAASYGEGEFSLARRAGDDGDVVLHHQRAALAARPHGRVKTLSIRLRRKTFCGKINDLQFCPSWTPA